ncbi:MAG TPA: ABC transporter ATP-binding protein [Acidimicrobiales bacterium]
MPVLEVVNLTTHIQLSRSVVQPVGNISFSLEAGETLGLVGESGSGKSMTGLSIMRLLPGGGRVVSGSILLNGQDLVTKSDVDMQAVRGNEVAMIFQDSLTSLNPTMNIGDQIAEPLRRHRRLSKSEALDRAAEMLGLVGFPRPKDQLATYPHQLSGGQRQRVMIAIALSCDPKVLIADEPTTALDVTIQAQILALLDDLKARLGMAVLLITHDMGVVAGRADRVNVMYAGRIVESASTSPMFSHMHHPYTQALLGSIPKLTQDPEIELFSIPGLPPDLIDPPAGCRFAARCRLATDQCRVDEPPLIDPAGGHAFACWHPVDGPVDLESVTAARLPPAVAAEPATSPNPDVLVLQNLVREYPITSGMVLRRQSGSVKAVSDVSLSVGRGETFGLVGESGCGKTTLGKIIVGLERPDSGSAVFEGTDISGLSQRAFRRFRRDLQMMFQDPIGSLDPRMRVGAVLREPMEIQGIGNRRSQDAITRELLGEVGLPASAVERFPHEFSGGQRQRIGLARVLTLNPKVIVADEPVSALDVSIRSQVLNLMKRLQDRHGMTYVVISHDLAVVKYLADHIGVMYLGKLVETGSADDIYQRAAHHYTAGLIATIPEPDPDREKAKTVVPVTGELPSAVDPPSGCRFRTRCPAAQDRCAAEEPPMRSFGPGHQAACHFPLRTPVADPVRAGARSVH